MAACFLRYRGSLLHMRLHLRWNWANKVIYRNLGSCAALQGYLQTVCKCEITLDSQGHAQFQNHSDISQNRELLSKCAKFQGYPTVLCATLKITSSNAAPFWGSSPYAGTTYSCIRRQDFQVILKVLRDTTRIILESAAPFGNHFHMLEEQAVSFKTPRVPRSPLRCHATV